MIFFTQIAGSNFPGLASLLAKAPLRLFLHATTDVFANSLL